MTGRWLDGNAVLSDDFSDSLEGLFERFTGHLPWMDIETKLQHSVLI